MSVPFDPPHAYIASQAAIPGEAFDSNLALRWNPVTGNAPIFEASLGTHLLKHTVRDDFYYNHNLAGKPYFADIGKAAEKLYNFFNFADYATNSSRGWPLTESLKPDATFGLDYQVLMAGAFRRKLGVVTFLRPTVPNEAHELFAFAAQPRSRALGAYAVGGAFDQPSSGPNGVPSNGQVDLRTLVADLVDPVNFNQSTTDHSAQFEDSNVYRKYYWWEVMGAFNLPHVGDAVQGIT
jgi:hypothetical protein